MNFKQIKKNIRFYLKKSSEIENLEKKFENKSPKIISKIDKVKLLFESSENPLVSIIIPFYNEEDYTWNCLLHLHKNLKNIPPFEIILIDDNSTQKYDFSLIEGIQIIKNNENLGFLRNINKGIQISKGEFIYILNNDTEVQEHFLEELLYVFNHFPNVGAVGSQLINSDGTLQEAGSIFMKDCQITQINFKKLYFPEINYIRKVDYASGCSLLFKKWNDHNEINLLDEKFIPAYFEETDFCFQLKYLQNKDIYYTPFSKVLHYNGITYNSKKEVAPNSKSKKEELFAANLVKFKTKWNDQLDAIKATSIEERIQEIYQNKSIVFFVGQIPEPDKDSGSNRLKEIILAYRNIGYHITLVANETFYNDEYVSFFQRLGVNVFYQYKKNKGLEYYFEKQKLNASICWFYNPAVFLQYNEISKKCFPNATLIYDMVDIHHLRYFRAFELDNSKKSFLKEYEKFKKMEIDASKIADYVITISDSDKDYMKQFCDEKKIITISNIHYPKIEKSKTLSFEDRNDILFIGSIHAPNIDAIYYLYNEIMPIVWQKLPEIKVNIIGNVNELIKDINHPNFVFHGFVPDVEAFFISNKLMVAPLRYGAGVKGKIGQGFEYYLPVITSSIGAEGMKLINNENAIIDDTAEGFAKNIIALYDNKELWLKLQNKSEESLYPFSKEHLIKEIVKIH